MSTSTSVGTATQGQSRAEILAANFARDKAASDDRLAALEQRRAAVDAEISAEREQQRRMLEQYVLDALKLAGLVDLQLLDASSRAGTCAVEEQQDAASATSLSPRRVKLNVGGTVFSTTVDTLTNKLHGETFFSALLSGQFADAESDESSGEIFVDRDPTHFRLILNHLRGIDVTADVKELSDNARERLADEADFYQVGALLELLGVRPGARLPPLALAWHEDDIRAHEYVRVSQNPEEPGSVTFTNADFSGWPNPVVVGASSAGLSSGAHEWYVRIDSLDSASDWIGLGVCRAKDMLPYVTGNGNGSAGHKFFGKCSSGSSHRLRESASGFCSAWTAGSIVRLKLDCDAGKLHVDDDVVVDVPAGEELRPVFLLYRRGNACTLLPPVAA